MPFHDPTPKLDDVQNAIHRGDLAGARKALFELSDREQELLKAEVGEHDFKRIYASARRVRRGEKNGRVILLHGIMGSELDVVKKGDADRVWINYWRLMTGRIADLELTQDGDSAKSGVQVRVTGQNRKYYLPMLLELDQEWHVRPFAYDWREDITKSAHRLAAEFKSFSNGEPVHLVAHSMGGLVSRCLIKLYPELWTSMKDPDGLARGGRLIMLGTPNHGSYSIPLALSGGESKVKMLETFDLRHDMPSLLGILNTFPGSYQMLPSQLVELDDDHKALFERSSWGNLPVHQTLLDQAAEFHRGLWNVFDTERFLYVAGYNRKTPFRIRVQQPGKFEYRETLDGDGRVPHELGLLPDVGTFWVDENHGSLARNDDVLDCIHELLAEGSTQALTTVRSAKRKIESAEWLPAEKYGEVPEEFSQLLKSETRRKTAKQSKLDRLAQIRIENFLLEEELGRSGERADSDRLSLLDAKSQQAARPTIKVQVVWGDITAVESDIYCVGHYQGVLPQKAEEALDNMISRTQDKNFHVIRQHTLRGYLRGALGDVNFFPLKSVKANRTVAVAGMGHPGVFGRESLRVLVRKLIWSISSLPNVKEVSTVLIGSGEGTLSVEEAVDGLVRGLTDAMIADNIETDIRTLKIVERYRHRAIEILWNLQAIAEHTDIQDRIKLELLPEIKRGAKSEVSGEDALQLLFEAAIKGVKKKPATKLYQAIDTLVSEAKVQNVDANDIRDALESVANLPRRTRDNSRPVRVTISSDDGPNERHPIRITFIHDGRDIRVAAITETTTVPERVLRFDTSLVDEVTQGINAQQQNILKVTSAFMTRLLLPKDFRGLLRTGGPFIFEVDRNMAKVHWEILAQDLDPYATFEPLGVRCQVARQLRTTYSPPPLSAGRPREFLKALIIGDPGDPDKGHNLPGAREEALKVYHVLKNSSVDCEVRIGSGNVPRRGNLRHIKPANRLEVLHLLMQGGFDILHYTGHGDFDPDHPERVGWLFAEGLLTARELERIDEAPALVVANACLSARTSEALERGRNTRASKTEADLLPSLADEFFRQGVRNYIGTAWEVSDVGAVMFAEQFYATLLAADDKSIGEALQAARRRLYAARHLYGQLWAAYQHYGDPSSNLRLPELR